MITTLSSAPRHDAVMAGVPLAEFLRLAKRFGLPPHELAALCGMSPMTWSRRRRSSAALSVAEGDRLSRFAELFALADETFNDRAYALAWMKHPAVGLGGRVPLEFSQSHVGATEVRKLLTRIHHGVYA